MNPEHDARCKEKESDTRPGSLVLQLLCIDRLQKKDDWLTKSGAGSADTADAAAAIKYSRAALGF